MDARSLAHRLEGHFFDHARHFRAILCQEPFQPLAYVAPSPERVLAWCRWFADAGYGRLGLPQGDPTKFHCLSHELGFFDFNLMMRMGLQFGFVLRAVSRLGSDEQDHWLDKLANMELLACLAMTEVDHGSNVKGLQTTATYDTSTRSFVLQTPQFGATKDYVCSVDTAQVALVFSRLQVDAKEYGVHALMVPLRSEDGALLPGITVTDCEPLGGMPGLTFGRLSFKNVLVPRENLLSRHGGVGKNGTYKRELSSESHRFNAMMGTLVVGRSVITAGAAAGAKVCLIKTLNYVNQRRQFTSEPGEPENTLLSYQAVQRRLMPRLAVLLAIDAGRDRLAAAQHKYEEDSTQDRKLETFTSSLKSYTTSFAVELAQICRQSCGGVGCMESTRLTQIRRDLDLFTTMEGDNTILDLMVARNLLTDFKRGLSGGKILKTLGKLLKAMSMVMQTNPLKSHGASSEELRSQEFLGRALRFRKERLHYSLARRVAARLRQEASFATALNECQDHCLALSKAHCEEKIYRCLRNVTESCPPGWDRKVLEQILSLFALSRIEDDRAWFLEQGYVNARQSKSIRREVLQLSSELAQEAEMLVKAFEIPQKLLGQPLAEIGRT